MSVHEQPAFVELVRSARCADDALLSVAVQPLYELIDLALQKIFGLAPQPEPKPRPSVPPSTL